MNYNRVLMKQRAREAVRITRPRPALVMLVFLLLVSVVPMVLQWLIPNPFSEALRTLVEYIDAPWYWGDILSEVLGSMLLWALVSVLVAIAIYLFQAVMNYGLAGYSLKLYRRQESGYGDIFSGFRCAGRAIGATFMVGVFTFLWSLLIVVAGVALIALMAFIAASADSEGMIALMVLWALAVYIAVLVGVIMVSYRYCLTPYYVMDHPEMGVFEAITASKTTMRGNIRKRFTLDLSFFGWYALLAGILYVGLIVGMIVAIPFTDFGSLYSGNYYDYYGMYGSMYGNMYVNSYSAGLTPLMIGMFGGMGVAYLASLPLSLWLSAYTKAASAGFYVQIIGEEIVQPPTYQTNSSFTYTYGAPTVPPVPPTPPTPPVPPAPPAPVPPAPPAPVPPAQPPVPEAPEVPAETVRPEDPVPEAPAEPVAPEAPVEPPVPEAPVEPVTPEVPAVPAEEAPVPPAQFCTQCGAALTPDARFCPNCGKAVE